MHDMYVFCTALMILGSSGASVTHYDIDIMTGIKDISASEISGNWGIRTSRICCDALIPILISFLFNKTFCRIIT